MNSEMRCGDPAALAGYLYEEMDPAEREAVERHLAVCEICASDVEGLRGTRSQLAAWTPPAAALGFRIVSDAAATSEPETVPVRPVVATSPAWWQWSAMPAWAQAAAAVMLFAGGAVLAALMNMEVRYDQAGLTIRTGWQSAAAPSGASASAGATANTQMGAANVSATDLSALESRMRAEFMQARSANDGGTRAIASPNAGQPVMASSEVMQRVRQIVAESEQRQQRELALRLTQAVRELDTTHRADLERIERTVSPMEEQQRQMLNYISRVSQQR